MSSNFLLISDRSIWVTVLINNIWVNVLHEYNFCFDDFLYYTSRCYHWQWYKDELGFGLIKKFYTKKQSTSQKCVKSCTFTRAAESCHIISQERVFFYMECPPQVAIAWPAEYHGGKISPYEKMSFYIHFHTFHSCHF